MLYTEELTKLFVKEMRADQWCHDIIRTRSAEGAAEKLKAAYLYSHDGKTVSDRIMQMVIPQLDWPAMIAAVEADKQEGAAA